MAEQQGIESSLKAALGEKKVDFSPDAIQRYAASIHGPECRPLAVVRPTEETEVIKLVQLADRLRFPLYPISRGKNLGYGDAHGSAAGQVIVDLSGMSRVLEVNETLGYATIEPGVSQEQFHRHLKATGSRLQMDVTGAGLQASIVGNALERGFGHTDYGDRYFRIINLRAVLMDGSVIDTGFADHEHADAANTYRPGYGPAIEGLFSQSNFGIITRMTFELMPVPEKTVMFAVSAKKVSDLDGIIDAIRELKLSGVLHSAVHIANRSRALGNMQDRVLGAWNLSGSIAGPRIIVDARKKLVRRTFAKKLSGHRLVFLDSFRMKILGWIHSHLFRLSFYPTIHEVFQEQNGVPTDDPLKTLLDDRDATSADLAIDSYPTCFSWINAVCKAEPDSVRKAVNVLEQVFAEHGYEFRVTMTAVNPRTFILISNITYPRDAVSVAKAQEFKHRCYEVLRENGFLPYRSGSGMFNDLPPYSAARKVLLNRLKEVFDPKKLLAPGKYNLD